MGHFFNRTNLLSSIMFLAVLASASAAPVISWESPTLPSGSTTPNNWVYLEAGVSDGSDTSAFFDWDNSLVAYWSFESSNSTHFFDSSPNEHHLFSAGTIHPVVIASNRGNGVEFNQSLVGQDSLTSSEQFDTGDEITVEAWVNVEQGNEGAIIRKWKWGEWSGFHFDLDHQRLQMVLGHGDGTGTEVRTNVGYFSDYYGSWTHVAATGDSDVMRLYINGDMVVEQSPLNSYAFYNDIDLVVGGGSGWSGQYFNGSIDEVRIYDRVLSPDEIKASYDSSNDLYHNFTGLSEGTYDYTAWAINTAGEITTLSGDVTYDAGYVGDDEPPVISWEPPTLADGATTFENWVYLNTGISDDSDTSAFFDWNNSLVGYWSFEYYNETGVFDNSTYQNFCIFTGIAFGTDKITTGRYGDALEFDEDDDYLDCGYDPNLDITNEITVEAWIKPDELDSGYIVDRMTGGPSGQGFLLDMLTGGTLQFDIRTSDGDRYTNTLAGIVSTGSWHHVVGTYNGTHTLIYVNGDKKMEKDFGPEKEIYWGSSENLNIGGSYADWYFNGSIDEVRIHKRVLSAEEISASYGGSQLSRNFTGLSVGSYGCTVWAVDSYGNMATAGRSVLLSVVQGTPSVTLVGPDDDAGTNDTQPVFSFIVDDSDDESVNCSLYLDGGFVETKEAVSDGFTEGVFISPVLSFGVHLWFVNCTDGVNIGVSPAWSLTVFNESFEEDNETEINETEVNDTQPPPANDTNDTIPPQNGSEDLNMSSPGSETNQTEVNVSEPVCGNGVKEEGEECDGEDGVPEEGYWCDEDCKLHFPGEGPTLPYYEQEVDIGFGKISYILLLVGFISLLIILAVLAMFYYKEKLKNMKTRMVRKDTLKELDELTKKDEIPENIEEDIQKPSVPTLDDIDD